MRRGHLAWALPLLLAGCGDLPRPFQNNPGAAAVRLSQPPPPRLAVPAPPDSLLTNAAAATWAGALADALVANEVPAVAEPSHRGDWHLTLHADLHGGTVVPTYTVQNPRGEAQGSVQGAPVPAAAWADGAPATLTAAAASVAPQIASLLTSIEAARQQSDPNSLLNRPAHVFVASVTGAPGDGNTALTRQMRLQLPQVGEVVQPDAAGADYVVQGTVKLAASGAGQSRVEITWVVTDGAGREGGRIAQLNDVPAGSLSQYWGDVALVVAQQAAGGVRDVITNQLITHRGPAGGHAAPNTPPAGPVS